MPPQSAAGQSFRPDEPPTTRWLVASVPQRVRRESERPILSGRYKRRQYDSSGHAEDGPRKSLTLERAAPAKRGRPCPGGGRQDQSSQAAKPIAPRAASDGRKRPGPAK